MSFVTPADAAYIKGSVRKIAALIDKAASAAVAGDATEALAEYYAELARLEAFIDGCTLERGKA